MGSFNGSLTRMRRMLRDPDGNIWSSQQLRMFWNDAQEEVFRRISILSRVETQRYPYEYDYIYLHDFEKEYIEGDTLQAFHYVQNLQGVATYAWESSAFIGDGPDDGGYSITYPFEAYYAAPAEPIRNILHSRFYKARYLAYDEEEIKPITLREIQESDRYYKTRAGESLFYYRPDEMGNEIAVYPRPALVLSDEVDPFDSGAADTFGGASFGAGSGFGGTTDPFGIKVWQTDYLDFSDLGVTVEQVGAENNLFIAYYYLPYDIQEGVSLWEDDLEFPAWMVKYVEYGVLERAFGVDNDGTHGPLKDYWKRRKEIGIKILESYKRKLLGDRTIEMGRRRPERIRRRAQLPSTYPRVG